MVKMVSFMLCLMFITIKKKGTPQKTTATPYTQNHQELRCFGYENYGCFTRERTSTRKMLNESLARPEWVVEERNYKCLQ